MKISSIALGSLFALALVAGTDALAASGKIEAVENEGRQVTIAGTTYKVSGSRTKITVAGAEAGRDALQVGMECTAEGSEEATMIACK